MRDLYMLISGLIKIVIGAFLFVHSLIGMFFLILFSALVVFFILGFLQAFIIGVKATFG